MAACLLADASKHVVLGSRSADKGEAAVAELSSRKLPGSVELLTLDVADEHSISQAAELVTQRHGRCVLESHSQNFLLTSVIADSLL